jgi:hypothetical protein
MKNRLSGKENRGFCQLRQTLIRSIFYASDVFIFVSTVCQNIQELSQKWLHALFQVSIPCIPGEHVYA